MRTSQTPEQRRKWPSHFLNLLKQHEPGYEMVKLRSTIRAECIREAPPWYLSQSTICIHGRYNHCFCLLLAPTPAGRFLSSVFQAGGRLDGHYLIADAFDRDLRVPDNERPRGVQSTHNWRSGTDAIVDAATRNAEKFLRPFYEDSVSRAAPELLRLIDTYARGEIQSRGEGIQSDISLLDLATRNHPWFQMSETTRYSDLVADQIEEFEAVEPHLDRIRDSLSAITPSG